MIGFDEEFVISASSVEVDQHHFDTPLDDTIFDPLFSTPSKLTFGSNEDLVMKL